MDVDELINKLRNILNELIDRNDSSVKTVELSNQLLETLKVIENCKDKKMDDLDEFHKSINEIENCLTELEKKEFKLNKKLFRMDNKLNKEILCQGCKEKEIKKLADKCENEEIARFIYQCKLN